MIGVLDGAHVPCSKIPRSLANLLQVSVLGLGAAGLGGSFGEVKLEARFIVAPLDTVADFFSGGFQECIATVHEAITVHGVNIIDTSPYYGNAETVLGKCLHGIDRSTIVVCTKMGRYGEADFDFSAERAERSVRESIEKMDCGHIDLLQLHDVEFADLDQIVEANHNAPFLHGAPETFFHT